MLKLAPYIRYFTDFMQRDGKHHSRYLRQDKSVEMSKQIAYIGLSKLLDFPFFFFYEVI